MIENAGMGLVAYLLDLVSVFTNQVAFALQKLSHRDLEKLQQAGDVKTGSSALCRGKGVLGLLLLIVAAVMHIFAVSHADLTLLSCNSLMGSIANVLISTKFLGERFDASYDFPGLSLLFVGCLFIVLLSNKEKHEVNLQDLIYDVTRIKSILYISTVQVVVMASKFTGNFFEIQLRKFEKECEKWEEGSQNKLLPPNQGPGERPLRVVISVICGMNMSDILLVSPNSAFIKRFIKLPLVLGVTSAAMFVSLSDL